MKRPIQYKFMDHKTRSKRRDLFRSTNVSNVRNDLEGKISKISNEKLLASQFCTLPNFALLSKPMNQYFPPTTVRNSNLNKTQP